MNDESPKYENNPTIHAYLRDLELAMAVDRAHYAYDRLRLAALELEPSIEERFNDLRVHIKYLLFDVEATRRENQYLREMLEGQGRR